MGEPLNVGIIGVGKISEQYLATFDQLADLSLVAVADLDVGRARAVAESRSGVRACTVEQLLAMPDVQTVVNLTTPAAHHDVDLQIIAAVKDVYSEKPLTVSVAQARAVLDAAAAARIVIGCAPDTVLGTGIQTARKTIDDGLIGAPISASATMVTPGHERWHPNPDFYYGPGGGPLLDMGPYYLSALVTLLGPIRAVIGAASRTRETRIIGSGPRLGEVIPVTTDSHITGILTHSSGALSTLVVSFDAVATQSANIEIHGETGSLVVPDPNHFSGEVKIRVLGGDRWDTLPVSAGYIDASRGVGIVDWVTGSARRAPRAGSELAFHVLEVMMAISASAESGQRKTVTSTVDRPAPVPLQQLRRR